MRNLRSLIFTISIIILGSYQANAQRNKVAVGPTFSSLYVTDGTTVFSDDEGYKCLVGPYIGGFAEFFQTDFVSIWAGATVGSRGSRFKLTTEIFGEEYASKSKTTFYYIDIPVFARADFEIGSLAPYAFLGPYGGFAFYGHSTFVSGPVGGDPDFEGSDSIEFGDEGFYNRFDFGLNGGMGLVINQFDIEFSYLFGLANISSFDSGDLRVNNRSLRFSFGYYFNQAAD